jgi:hypothetical protein
MKIKAPTPRNISVYVSFFVLLLLCSVTMTNCKRDRLAEPAAIKKTEDENIAALLKMVSENKKSYYLPLNQQVQIIWIDKNGNEIKGGNNGGVTTNSTAPAICDDPRAYEGGKLSLLTGIRNTQATCGNGDHTLEVNWKIYTPLEIFTTSIYNTNSFGRMRIRNGSSTVWSSPNIFITNPDLVFIGMDPDEPTIRMYTLKYIVTGVPHTYFQSGNATSVQFDFKIYSDCNNEVAATPPSWTAGFAPYSIENAPCQRIDVCTIMPYTGNGSSTPPYNSLCGMIAGTDPTALCPSAPTFYINLGTEVQVKLTGDPDINYRPLETYASGLSDERSHVTGHTNNNGYIFHWEARFMKELHYVPNYTYIVPNNKYTFRWRNIHGSWDGNTAHAANITCTGTWSNELIEIPIKDF